MKDVLLLNSSFEAFSIIPVEKAVNLILKEKVEILHSQEDKPLRSVHFELDYPEVIRLRSYVRWNKRNIAPTKKAIMERDNFICQYCGKKLSNREATIDHIIPKKMKGGNTWDNMVCSCEKCNKKKGDRTPKEAGITLNTRHFYPSFLAYFHSYSINNSIDSWKPYIFLI
jgi:5-methylcytosine-specific restriction endonuclease McrA